MTVHFSSTSLGPNAGFLGLFSNSPGMDFGAIFGQSRTEILVLFLDSL